MKKLNKQDGILISELAVIVSILLPIMAISLLALPLKDDFFNANRMRMVLGQEYSYIKAAWSETLYYYKNVSGYFFGAFLNFFITPLLRGGIPAVRGTVLAINLFFYASLYFFTDSVLKFFFDRIDRKKILFIYIIALISVTNNYGNIETWTWYCVLIGYVFIVACMFWGILFFLKALQNDKIGYVSVASVIGFLVSGGPLNVTALNCGLFLIVGIMGYFIYKKIRTPIICFGSALAGGLINAAAPGNFIRHEQIDMSYGIVSSLKDAMGEGVSRVIALLTSTPFVLLLVIFFIFSLKNINQAKKEWKIHPIIILLLIFVGVMIVVFPVRLGYNAAYQPRRCIWVEDITIYIGMFGWSAYLAGWLKGRGGEFELKKEHWLCIAVSSLFFVCSLGGIRNVEYYPTVQMIRQLSNGQLKQCAEFWEGILEEIETSTERDVVIYRESILGNELVLTPGMGEDTEDWENKIVAEYYGKDSVCIAVGQK